MERHNRVYLPGWTILEPPIGSGGFSTVYEIVRTDEFGIEEHAALKVISVPENKADITAFRDDGLDDKSITAYFKTQVDDISKEFFLLSGMKGNSHIVSYEDHQIVQHDNDPGWDILIRMELLASLTDYYRANFLKSEIDELTVIKLGVDLCRALELCQKKNIIHRDIKPQNIFVNQNGDFKLGDFGIARVSDHTTRATKAGTYTYMAPEVYLGKNYNAKVDQYSLGLVLYWLLNERRMPFAPQGVPTADENSKALQRRMDGEPIPEPLHGSPELKKIVLRACAFDPADRFSGPEELRCTLELSAHGGIARWFPGEIPVGIKREKRLEQKPDKAQWNGQTVGKYTNVRINNQVKKICKIVFRDENETVLSEREYAQGEKFDVPFLEDKEDAQYFYQFAGWTPRLESTTVEKDIIYTARYEKIKKKKRWQLPAVCGAAALVIAAVCILGSQVKKLSGDMRSEDDKQGSETIAVEEATVTAQKEQESVTLASLSLSNDALKLFVGREAQLSATAAPAEYSLDNVEWSSSNAAVAAVDKTGLVAAKGAGTATVTAKADGKTAACQITVEDQEIASIILDSSSAKTEYFVGEAFDGTGLRASIKYNTGDEENVSSGFTGKLDSSAAGKSTVTVYYGSEQAGTYSVTVKKAEVRSIRIVNLPNTALTEGESLNMSGLEIEAAYSDGSTKNISAGDGSLSCSPTAFSSAGTQTVTVSYGGKTTTFTVQVAAIDRYAVSLSSSNSSYGTVSGGGNFKKGELVTIEATPGEGCQFDAWSDGSTQPRRSIKVDGTVSLTAYFYGPLSNWSERVPSNAVVVDEETQYRCRDLKTTSSTTQSSMSGWTLVRTQQENGEWSAGKQTSERPTESDTLRITASSISQYAYYHYCSKYNGGYMVDSCWVNDTSHYCLEYFSSPLRNWANGCLDQGGNAASECYSDGYKCANGYHMSVWWRSSGDDKYTYEYQTREQTTRYFFQQYGAWSEWGFHAYQESDTRNVETRSVYRYRPQ